MQKFHSGLISYALGTTISKLLKMFSRNKEGETSITRKARGLMFRSMSPLSSQKRRVKLENNDRSESDVEASASRRLLQNTESTGTTAMQQRGRRAQHRLPTEEDESSVSSSSTTGSSGAGKRMGFMASMRSRSRSSSSSRSRGSSDFQEQTKQVVVAVTSCRSDAYHHPKGASRSVLPRNAPPVLKLFHELAVGVQDAYAAVGATPTKPELLDSAGKIATIGEDRRTRIEEEGRKILWEFMEHLDFLLAVVDEVALDTATRGALKEDSKFKVLRDTIKKCNKSVLETMLVRRERKYTLFYRLVSPNDEKEIAAMKKWNSKVEKALGAVTEPSDGSASGGEHSDDEYSTVSGNSSSSNSKSNKAKKMPSPSIFITSAKSSSSDNRGRASTLPAAGKVRARRATPTPRLRQQNLISDGDSTDGSAAEDGFNVTTRPASKSGLLLPQQLATGEQQFVPGTQHGNSLSFVKPVKAKDELVDVIRGIKVEKDILKKNEGGRNDPADLKPNWIPKADIPATVPKLAPEYIHRHRLMKQAVNSLLGSTGADSDPSEEPIKQSDNCFITSITSRHSDKVGNGKTTLAVAAIQTVEVRERFSDGIAWIKLGKKALTEKDIRSLYENIYEQLFSKPAKASESTPLVESDIANGVITTKSNGTSANKIKNESTGETGLPLSSPTVHNNRNRFQFGELEGIREDLSEMICNKKILLCLDDVWRAEDACWFLFVQRDVNAKATRRRGDAQKENEERSSEPKKTEHHFKVLITTRFSALLGPGMAQEVFVRILTEHEAVKLLIAASGKRAQGGKSCAVVSEAKTVVKGCGNSPLAIKVAGGLLRKNDRWTLYSTEWKLLVSLSKSCLTEATQLRSFSKAFGRIVDLCFSSLEDKSERAALRRCFVMFAVIFDSDISAWGRCIPENVVLGLFSTIQAVKPFAPDNSDAQMMSPSHLLHTLEKMNLLEKTRITSCETDSCYEQSVALDTTNQNREQKTVVWSKKKVNEFVGYCMHDAIAEIAHEMSERNTPSFAPPDECPEEQLGSNWSTPLRTAAKYLVQIAQRLDHKNASMAVNQFHVFIVASLTGGWTVNSGKPLISSIQYGASLKPGVEEYLVSYLPSHLIKAKALASVANVLLDPIFIAHRVESMSPIDATRQHVADLVEFRRSLSKSSSKKKAANSSAAKNSQETRSPDASDADKEYNIASSENEAIEDTSRLDVGSVLRDACKHMLDEVYKVDSRKFTSVSSASLNMAICLSTLGEGLLKCRQPRDAMLRLEEAVGLYRGLLGPYHIDVARALGCVAKALVKLGEFRVAVLKFGEAARIYEACNATEHFDALSNSQSMAALLADLGDYSKAEARYESVIRIRRSLYGNMNPSVARTLNDYAVVLAKHGKINEAIMQYQEARAAFEGAASSKTTFAFVEAGGEYGFIYDAALIDMNIASIKVKGGDLEGAIISYLEGIEKMRQLDKCTQMESSFDGRSKHIIASMAKIGSLKIKLGDRLGALSAFEQVLKECETFDTTSNATKTEAAKAHVKCATLRRSMMSEDRRNHEISMKHLREALKLYTQLYGSAHRDTHALSSSLKQWEQEGVAAELRLLDRGVKR